MIKLNQITIIALLATGLAIGSALANSTADTASTAPLAESAPQSEEQLDVAATTLATTEGLATPTAELADVNVAPRPKPADLVDLTLQPSMQLLGSEVAPGTAEIVNWEFESTFVDISAPVPVLVVNGLKVGPTLCLTAAVHGDELNGIEIVRRVVHEIDPKKLSGAVIGVPIVNLQGFKRANRYLPDRRDLNRFFPGRENGSYASRIAHSFFSQIISQCDYLVDLHTGSLSRTNLPQLRANLSDPTVAALAEKMGSIVVLQSRGGVGTLRRAASDAGIPAVTLEAGAPNNLQKDAVEQGVKTISSALSSLGLSSKSRWKRSEEPVFYRSKWIRTRQGGILFSKVELGDSVEKDTVLGLLSNPITNKTTEILSPIEGRVIGMALNQVMYPGFAAYHIGLRSSMVEAALPEEVMPEDVMPDDEDVAQELDTKPSADVAALAEDSKSKVNVKEQGVAAEDPDEPDSNPIEKMELPTADAD